MDTIKNGQLFWYDFGDNGGSIQCGNRPVLVIQADDFNRDAPTVIIAAITSVIKKQYLPSHIILPDNIGLKMPSMVMLEQMRAVNKEDLGDYIGCLTNGYTWKYIRIGLKKVFGFWYPRKETKGEIRCLCPKCLEDYKSVPNYIVKRLDPFQREKGNCDKCNHPGYDYIICSKSALCRGDNDYGSAK